MPTRTKTKFKYDRWCRKSKATIVFLALNSENSECITQEVADLLPNCGMCSENSVYELLHVVGCTCIQVYELLACNCNAIKTPSRYFSSV